MAYAPPIRTLTDRRFRFVLGRRFFFQPPDLARVASSFALLGALLVALILSWALGG